MPWICRNWPNGWLKYIPNLWKFVIAAQGGAGAVGAGSPFAFFYVKGYLSLWFIA